MKNLLLALLLTVSVNVFAQEAIVCVERVIDGDTVVLDGGERVRLLRIDTPERKEKGFQEAKDWMINRVEGLTITIVRKGTGFYKRTLAELYVDGVNINDELLELGLAKKYRK